MQRFKIGDKVMVRGSLAVLTIDGYDNGDCDYLLSNNYFYHDEELEPVKEVESQFKPVEDDVLTAHSDSITITVDGKTVTAKYKDQTAVVKCSPEDTFDLRIGAELAISRLVFPRAPFRPKQGETYYYVVGCGDFTCVGDTIQDLSMLSYCHINTGNCYRTYAEAEAAIPEWKVKRDEFFASC